MATYYHVVAVSEHAIPLKNIVIEAIDLTDLSISATQTTNDSGEAAFTGLTGPHFFRPRARRTSTTVGERVYTGRVEVQIVSMSAGLLCFDYVVDENGGGTHTDLGGTSGALQAGIAAGGDIAIWMCNSETFTREEPITSLNGRILIEGPSSIAKDEALTFHGRARVVITAAAGEHLMAAAGAVPAADSGILFRDIGISTDCVRAGAGASKAVFAANVNLEMDSLFFYNCNLDVGALVMGDNTFGFIDLSVYAESCWGQMDYLYISDDEQGHLEELTCFDCNFNLTGFWDDSATAAGGTSLSTVIKGGRYRIAAGQELRPTRAGGDRPMGFSGLFILFGGSDALFYTTAGDTGILNLYLHGLVIQFGHEDGVFGDFQAGALSTGSMFIDSIFGYPVGVAPTGTFLTIDLVKWDDFYVGDFYGRDFPTQYSGPPVVPPTYDHDDLPGLDDDDHTQYWLLAGRAGQNLAYGDVADGADLTISSTAHANKGSIYLGSASEFELDEATGEVKIPTGPLSVGADDTTAGLLVLYGPSAGDEGGEIQLYMSAAHDAVSEHWAIDVYEDDLRFWPEGNPWGGQVKITSAGQLQLPVAGVAGGLLLGADVHLYRGAADRLDLASGDSLQLTSANLLLTGAVGALSENTTALGLKLAAYSTTYGIGVQTNVMEFITPADTDDFRWGHGASGALTEIMFLDSGSGWLTLPHSGSGILFGGNAYLYQEAAGVLRVVDRLNIGSSRFGFEYGVNGPVIWLDEANSEYIEYMNVTNELVFWDIDVMSFGGALGTRGISWLDLISGRFIWAPGNDWPAQGWTEWMGVRQDANGAWGAGASASQVGSLAFESSDGEEGLKWKPAQADNTSPTVLVLSSANRPAKECMFYDASVPSWTNHGDGGDEAAWFEDDVYVSLGGMTNGAPIDYLYLGFGGPELGAGGTYTHGIVGFYADVETPNTNAATMEVEYYDGAAWQPLSGTPDWSDGTALGGATFGQPGLVEWTQPGFRAWEKLLVNGVTTYWVRVSVSATLSGTVEVDRIWLQTVRYLTVGDEMHYLDWSGRSQYGVRFLYNYSPDDDVAPGSDIEIRLESGARLRVEENTGTLPAPTWTTRFQFLPDTGAFYIATSGSGAGIFVGNDAQWYRYAENVMALGDDDYMLMDELAGDPGGDPPADQVFFYVKDSGGQPALFYKQPDSTVVGPLAAAGIPGAHKDTHDPEDGADPLDTAVAGVIQPDDVADEGSAHSFARSDHVHEITCDTPNAIVGVQAGAEGNQYFFARSDHDHQIDHSILDNALVTIDGDPNLGEYARWTADGLEGRTAAQVITDLGVIANSLLTNRGDLIRRGAAAPERFAAVAAGAVVGGDGTDVVATVPKRTIVLTAAGGKPTTTSGCSEATQVEAGTNDVDYWVLDFDKDAAEHAFWTLVMPDNWDGGTLIFRAYWTAAEGAGTVKFTLAGRSYANSDAIDQAYTDAGETVTDTLITAGDVHISPESAAVTLNGGPVGGEFVQIRVSRDISDTLTADARLLAIKIVYGLNAVSDYVT